MRLWAICLPAFGANSGEDHPELSESRSVRLNPSLQRSGSNGPDCASVCRTCVSDRRARSELRSCGTSTDVALHIDCTRNTRPRAEVDGSFCQLKPLALRMGRGPR